MFKPISYPDAIEPLVNFVEDTSPDSIVAGTYEKLRSGTSKKDMLLASALAVMRSSDLPPGHHGGPLHPIAGQHAIYHTAERLPGDYGLMPVVQNVALSNKHIHAPAMGPYILPDAEAVSVNDSVEETLEAMEYYLGRGEFHACDHYFLYFWQQMSPMKVLDQLLQIAIPKNQLDDHNFLFPVFTWRGLDLYGAEYGKYLIRPAVRYVTRKPAAPYMTDIDAMIEEYGLLKRDLRMSTGADETPAIEALRDQIGSCNKFNEIPSMLAHALADGLSLEGVGEGLSLGGSKLFLRSQTGNPMDVHINTGANARRYLIRQPELALKTKLWALLMYDTGPEVLLAQRQLAPEAQPEPERVEALSFRTQDELLQDIEELILSLPIGERLPATGLATWRCTDEVKHAAALAQQYANYEYDPEALVQTLGKIVWRDDFTEMHAYKHHQATYEEFHTTRPELRWLHLVSAVQAAAVSHGRRQDVFEDAVGLMHV